MIGFIVLDSKTIKSPQTMRTEYPDVILGIDGGFRHEWYVIVMPEEVWEHRLQTTFQMYETVFSFWRVK